MSIDTLISFSVVLGVTVVFFVIALVVLGVTYEILNKTVLAWIRRMK